MITIALSVMVIIVLYLYSVFDPSDSVVGKFFPKCLVWQLTGLQCPGCGIQRAAHSLLQGDLIGAVRHNWFLIFSLSYLLALILTGSFCRLRSPWRVFFWGRWGCFLYISLYFLWFVVRNILSI